MKEEPVSTTQNVSPRNDYLDQVVAKQAQLECDLKARRAAPAGAARARMIANPCPEPSQAFDDADFGRGGGGIEPGPVGSNAVDVRVSGFWRWKSVVVPPNAYVIHTRRGHAEPLHCGLGVSFRFDPVTDAFLVVPAAMQTILINATCISRERQGLLVQGYVQWIIEDFATAYRKLDFSDAYDPMRVVHVQLREQAEAAIKDVVATMSIDDVLADKQPIIKELVSRLRHVAEGDGQDKGLGLRIVTVQIKEAVVSSPKVWEMLQRPFRAERSKEARLAELTHEAVVRTRESASEQEAAAERIATQADGARLQAEAAAVTFDREQAERARRAEVEARTLEQAAAHEREKMDKEAALARLRLEHELALDGMRAEAENRRLAKEIEFEAMRRKIDNDLSAAALQKQLIDGLPAIAEKMPQPKELKSFQFGGSDALLGFVSGLVRMVEGLKTSKLD